MTPEDAIQALQALHDAGYDCLRQKDGCNEWRSESLSVLGAVFGPDSDDVRLYKEATRSFERREDGRDAQVLQRDAVIRGAASLMSSIAMLHLVKAGVFDPPAIDPELWAHVQGLINADDWAKVPAAVAIFVEDKVREWAGDPRQPNGEVLIGKSLYAVALKDEGPLRLGGQASEREGWRSLGTGLAQAVGNVDRHRIQRRADVKCYAMGVLGLGSLLLTQLRYEHLAQIQKAESLPSTEHHT
jgi:hypothetical protein